MHRCGVLNYFYSCSNVADIDYRSFNGDYISKRNKNASPDEISQAEAYKSWNMLEDSTLCEKINYKIRHELQKHRKTKLQF